MPPTPAWATVLVRSLLLLAGLLTAAWAVGRLAVEPLRTVSSVLDQDRLDALSLEDALALVCATVLVAGGLWLALICTLVVGEGMLHALRGSPPTDLRAWGCPAALRRLLLGCCGVALGTGLTVVPATADQPRPAGPAATALTGLATPDRVLGGPVRAADAGAKRGRPTPSAAGPRVVTVSPGDTLWAIAARALPGHASDAEITAAWHRLYAANRRTVGSDPDLILPGADLRLPLPLTHPGEERP